MVSIRTAKYYSFIENMKLTLATQNTLYKLIPIIWTFHRFVYVLIITLLTSSTEGRIHNPKIIPVAVTHQTTRK